MGREMCLDLILVISVGNHGSVTALGAQRVTNVTLEWQRPPGVLCSVLPPDTLILLYVTLNTAILHLAPDHIYQSTAGIVPYCQHAPSPRLSYTDGLQIP